MRVRPQDEDSGQSVPEGGAAAAAMINGLGLDDACNAAIAAQR